MECNDLFEYIDSSLTMDNPLYISGMDPLVIYRGENPKPFEDFIGFLSRNDFFQSKEEKISIAHSLETLFREEYQTNLSREKTDSLLTYFNWINMRLIKSEEAAYSTLAGRCSYFSAIYSVYYCRPIIKM